MIHRTLASGFVSLLIAIVAGIFLAYLVHHSDRQKRQSAYPSGPPPQDVVAAISPLTFASGWIASKAKDSLGLSSTPLPAIPATKVDSAGIWKEISLLTPPISAATASPTELPIPAPSDGISNRHALDTVISLLANSLKATQSSAGSMTAAADRVLPAIPFPEPPKPMTMLSISCYKESEMMAARTLSIHCRTCGSLSNSAGSDRIVVQGVVTEDIVSGTGKILIAAGSKVSGIGRVDSDSGRLKSRGSWSIFTGNHELRVQAEMKDADAGFPGIFGKETSSESALSQKQAVVRDGRYYFLTDKTPFVLSLEGEVALKDLKTLDSSE